MSDEWLPTLCTLIAVLGTLAGMVGGYYLGYRQSNKAAEHAVREYINQQRELDRSRNDAWEREYQEGIRRARGVEQHP